MQGGEHLKNRERGEKREICLEGKMGKGEEEKVPMKSFSKI